MRMMHKLPVPPLPSPTPPVFSIWCGEDGWDGVVEELAREPGRVPKSAQAIGTGWWGLQFAAAGAVPPLMHFCQWVRDAGKIPIVEVPANAHSLARKISNEIKEIVVSSPWNFPGDLPRLSQVLTPYFLDAPDPPVPHSDNISLPIPDTDFPLHTLEGNEELSYLSSEAKSIISVVGLLVEETKKSDVNVFLRGSAGGSALVCSLFGIPKHPRALFWRFYFPGRSSLPDIDIDTDQRERVLSILLAVCNERGYKPYRLLAADGKISPAGVLILPEELNIPEVGKDDLGIAISPFTSKVAEKGCKIDVLQSYFLGILRVFGHTVQDMCRLAQSPAPTPSVTAVIPHLRTRWGTSIMNRFRQVSPTITVDDTALLLALMRPGISQYADYILAAKYGCRVEWPQRYRPQGKIFVFQEDLMRFIAKQDGWGKADEIRRWIAKGSPQQKEEARRYLQKRGVDPRAASYTFCFSHAYLYAVLCMYYISQLAQHPQEVFEFFLSPPMSNVLTQEEITEILLEARKMGLHSLTRR